jgi:hypothetical protein
MRCVGVCAQMRDLAVGRQQGEQALMKQSMQFEFEKLLKQQLETRILALSEQVQNVKQAAEHSAQKLGFEVQVFACFGFAGGVGGSFLRNPAMRVSAGAAICGHL